MTKLLATLSLALLFPLAAHARTATFKVDVKASKATWEGRKLAGSHHGELQFKNGILKVAKDKLASGEVTIDMSTLTDLDQEGEFNTKLVNHLKSDDFFSVEKHPTSTLKITKVVQNGAKSTIFGDLTIKGITKPIQFPADVTVDGKKLSAKGVMTVDRTQFDIKFRSLKFFSNIGDKVINDEFTVGFDITASK